MKKILITLSILLLAGCSSYNLEQDFNYDQTTTQNITTTTSTKKMTTTTKKKTTKKTYKISTEEFGKYVENLLNDILQEESLLSKASGHSYNMPYIKVWLHPSKCIEKKEFDEMSERVSEKIFTELKKNKYKKGNIFVANYEILNVYFYNCGDGIYKNQLIADEVSQFYFLELKDYKTYEEYSHRLDNYYSN